MTARRGSVTQSYIHVINCPTVTVTPALLPNGTVGTAYSQILGATPAGGKFTYAVSGNLPPGLSLNPALGHLSGTPTVNGTFTFTITATGFGACSGARSYTITIGTGVCPTIFLPELPNGSAGQLYSNSIKPSPDGPYNYAVTAGSLPPGVSLFNDFGLLC